MLVGVSCSPLLHGQTDATALQAQVSPPSTSYLSAEPSAAAITPEELRKRYAFGNWAGLRTQLGRHGIVPTALLITDPFGNIHGGTQTGAANYSLFGVDIRLDTKALLGLKGGQLDIGGAVNFGTSLSRSYIGNTFPVQLADVAGAQPRLTYLSYTQALLRNRLSFRVGRTTLNSVFGEEFAGSEAFKKFVSVGFDLVPQGLFLDVPGGAGYPRATWGTRLKYSATKHLYVQGAAYNADAKQLTGDRHGVDFSLHGPVFAIGEAGFRHFRRPDDAKPSRNIKVGGFYGGGTHYSVKNGSLVPVKGLSGFYALADQNLFRLNALSDTPKSSEELSRWGEAELERRVGAFASVVVVPEARTNIVPYFFNVGLISFGLSPSRLRDLFGVGFAYGSHSRGPSMGISDASEPSVPRTPAYEGTLEVTYGFALRPGVLLQPDLQYILHPIGVPSRLRAPASNVATPNATAIGVNVVVNF
ncbi:carbohydrate porin [Acidisarcina polymorpha]|uniref:carbohydrate porin n=1 Tax=Acidisarcina polymorpha TaxID=2211140 RepID=UPI001F33794F|nr:carbohydrate porin [Acidisarcina polymorpha]